MTSSPLSSQPTLGERIAPAIPALSVLLAILLLMAPMPLAWGVIPQIPLLLCLVWASLAPRLLPAYAALLLGIIADLVTGVPLGINAFLLPAAVVAVRMAESRTEARHLATDWAFAASIVAVANLLGWQMLAFTGQPAPLGPIMAQAALTILAWPLVVRLAVRLRRRFLEV